MPTFDIVCKTDLMEMDNAINGVNRETKQRFDLMGSKCEVQRQENLLTIVADDDMKLRQMQDLIQNYAARRKIDMRSLDFQTPQDASGGSLRQPVVIKQGINQELSKFYEKNLPSKPNCKIKKTWIQVHNEKKGWTKDASKKKG